MFYACSWYIGVDHQLNSGIMHVFEFVCTYKNGSEF